MRRLSPESGAPIRNNNGFLASTAFRISVSGLGFALVGFAGGLASAEVGENIAQDTVIQSELLSFDQSGEAEELN